MSDNNNKAIEKFEDGAEPALTKWLAMIESLPILVNATFDAVKKTKALAGSLEDAKKITASQLNSEANRIAIKNPELADTLKILADKL